MFKKTTLALLGVALNSIAVAGSMGPVCSPGAVTVPCEQKAWDLGIQALYLQSLNDAVGGLLNGPNNTVNQVNGDWSWGFRAEGSYHFNTGNDATINWTHLGTNAVVRASQGFAPGIVGGALGVVPASFDSTLNDKFDQVNMVLGQHADFGLVKKMRFYGGLQYAKMTDYRIYYYTGPILPAPATSVSQFVNSDFNGIGPVTGIDYSYDLSNGFSITANGAASILYGTSRYNTGYVFNPVGLVVNSLYASKKTIVPSLEAKLGLNYAYQMATGVLNLEGGYEVIDYFRALQSQGATPINSAIRETNFGVYGPYFGVKYVGLG